MFIITAISISYFTANGVDWVSVRTPYNEKFVHAVKRIPTAHFDLEDKSWTCKAEYGNQLEKVVRRHFPNTEINIQDNRGKDLYEEAMKNPKYRECVAESLAGLENKTDLYHNCVHNAQ